MSKNVMFVHGMFLNAKSWLRWSEYFVQRGFNCIAPPWPLHEADPAIIRATPPKGLGELRLDMVIDRMREAAAPYQEDLILIGHSVGGLIVQKLLSERIGAMGVPICSVAPNRMLSFDWGFIKNSASITNPFKGDDLFPMDAAGFHETFGNTMTPQASDEAFTAFALPESRNVLRDCMGETGHIDLDAPHAPMLFIGAEKDAIIPAHLCQRNAKAYSDHQTAADFVEFPGRGHFICGQPGWEEVADRVVEWIGSGLILQRQQAAAPAHARL